MQHEEKDIEKIDVNEADINKKSIKETYTGGITIVSLLLCVAAAIYAYKIGILTSVDSLQQFIARFGIGGLFIFTAIQAVQVVIPILPGGIGCLGGVILSSYSKKTPTSKVGDELRQLPT